MKGPWKRFTQNIGSVSKYIAGRQLDTSVPLHSGNVEFRGDYTEDSAAVDALCEKLNAEAVA